MSEQSWNSWFDAQLDWMASGKAGASPAVGAPPPALVSDLQAAARLATLNLGAESKTRAVLRTRLAWMAMAKAPVPQGRNHPGRPLMEPFHFRSSWLAGLAAVFLAVFLTLFNQPALAMVQHFLGYGYLPEVGFFPVASTLLLKGPVELQQNDRQILVRQGIALQSAPAGPGVTWLWLEGDPGTLSLGETWLDAPQNQRLQVQAIDRVGSSRTRLTFEALPAGVTQAVLSLAGGWKIPLEWIRAAEAGLAPTSTSIPTAAHPPSGGWTTPPCLNVTAQLKMCAQAAYVDEQGTRLLLELQPLQSGTAMSWDPKMANQVELRDDRRKGYELDASSPGDPAGTHSLTLQFAAVSDGIADVTLHLPGIQIQQGGKEEWIAGPFDLPIHLPARGARTAPTPSVIQTGEIKPAPTPVITSQP